MTLLCPKACQQDCCQDSLRIQGVGCFHSLERLIDDGLFEFTASLTIAFEASSVVAAILHHAIDRASIGVADSEEVTLIQHLEAYIARARANVFDGLCIRHLLVC
jgi:hypothetical protein